MMKEFPSLIGLKNTAKLQENLFWCHGI